MISRFDNLDFWLKHVVSNSEEIEKNIDIAANRDRTEGSQGIIPILRHFVESVMCYVAIDSNKVIFPDVSTHKAINNASLDFFVKNRHKDSFLYFFYDLHQNIEKSSSHETIFFGDYAERLVIKYFDGLIKIKDYFKTRGIEILKNLSYYPLKMDKSLLSYYKVVIEALRHIQKTKPIGESDTFYILNKCIKSIDNDYFYEYTLSIADDNKSKSDKIIAFSKIDIFDNYAVKLSIYKYKVRIFNIETTLDVILKYDVSIRACEFEKIARILGFNFSYDKGQEDYKLMDYIQNYRMSLADIVRLPEREYKEFSNNIFFQNRVTKLQNIFAKARKCITREEFGTNTLLYLLATMNNSVLNEQIMNSSDNPISNSTLRLPTAVIPFERTPFCANLRGTIIVGKILFETIDIKGHEPELIKRQLDKECLKTGLIYCHSSLFDGVSDIDNLIKQFNKKINNYESMRISSVNLNSSKYYYIESNELTFKNIMDKISSLSNEGEISGFSNYVSGIITNKSIVFDDDTKKDAACESFNNRRVFFVYGPAGTGKSYFANKMLDILDGYNVLCISSTHASLNNLKRRISTKKAIYRVVESVARTKQPIYQNYDVVIIDECSTISNNDILKVLNNINPKFLLLIGDLYQIEAIEFGNWFALARDFLPRNGYVELNNCYRTSNNAMKNIWQSVRNINPSISEVLKNYEVSQPINEIIFSKQYEDDDVTLCLNYGGLYGINNINKLMQSKNDGKSIEWRKHIYKVGDPVLFKETKYFKDYFYNNLKGIIRDIESNDQVLTFTIEVKDSIPPVINDSFNKLKKCEYTDRSTTIVSFDVRKTLADEVEQDFSSSKIVPFNIAYAISIHKAQGLEFKNVDIVVSGEVDENVTHNIFYTAITRAVENLNIYWQPETEKKVIDGFKIKNYKQDVDILKQKYPTLLQLIKNYYKSKNTN